MCIRKGEGWHLHIQLYMYIISEKKYTKILTTMMFWEGTRDLRVCSERGDCFHGYPFIMCCCYCCLFANHVHVFLTLIYFSKSTKKKIVAIIPKEWTAKGELEETVAEWENYLRAWRSFSEKCLFVRNSLAQCWQGAFIRLCLSSWRHKMLS